MIKRKDGFSLVEMMVVVAIGGLIVLAFSQFINNALKGQKNVQNAVDWDILKTSVNLVLNTKACDGAFLDGGNQLVQFTFKSPLPTTGNVLNVPVAVTKLSQGGTPVLDMGKPQLGGGLTLTKVEISNAVADGSEVVGGVTYNRYASILSVSAKKADASFGAPGYDKTFGVRLLVNPLNANRVEKCSVGGSSHNVEAFRTAGGPFTWTVPPGVTSITVEVWGAGGGGCGEAGGAGGAGGYALCQGNVISGQTYTYSIGAGGLGGGPWTSGCPGTSAGGATRFMGPGIDCVATQGGAGSGGGGAGGSGYGAIGVNGLKLALIGGAGQDLFTDNQQAKGGDAPRGGMGGLGSGMGHGDLASARVIYSGMSPGGGGGAEYKSSSTAFYGGNGGDGMVQITY